MSTGNTNIALNKINLPFRTLMDDKLYADTDDETTEIEDSKNKDHLQSDRNKVTHSATLPKHHKTDTCTQFKFEQPLLQFAHFPSFQGFEGTLNLCIHFSELL